MALWHFGQFCISFWTVHARVLKFHIWIPHENIVDIFLFLSWLCPFPELCPFKNRDEILSAKYLKTTKARALKFGEWIDSDG